MCGTTRKIVFSGKWQEGLVPLIGIQEEDKKTV